MRRTASAALLLAALAAACGDDPVEAGDDAQGVGTRYMSTGEAITVATLDTTYFADGTVAPGGGTFDTSEATWVWDAEVLSTDDVDRMVVRYDVLEGEVELQTFTGLRDPSRPSGEGAWNELEVVDSRVLEAGEGARVELTSP